MHAPYIISAFYEYDRLQGEVEQAMAMYQELHRWEDAIAVAEARVSEWEGGAAWVWVGGGLVWRVGGGWVGKWVDEWG